MVHNNNAEQCLNGSILKFAKNKKSKTDPVILLKFAKNIEMRFRIFLVLALIFKGFPATKFHTRMTSVKCGASFKTSNVTFCFMKAYNRKYPLINAGFTLLRKVPNGRVGSFSSNLVFPLEFIETFFSFISQLNGNTEILMKK